MPANTAPELVQFIQNSQQWSRDAERSIRALQAALNGLINSGKTAGVDVALNGGGHKVLTFTNGVLVSVV